MNTAPTNTVSAIDLTKFLPKKSTINQVDPENFNTLVYGPPGTGKSSFLGCFPDLIWLAFEEGHKLIPGKKIVIDCWKHLGKAEPPYYDSFNNVHMSYVQAQALLQEVTDYRTIGVDTIDMMIKMCVDYHVGKAGISHIGELNDYGVTYDKCRNNPIRNAVMDLMKTGRGVVFTSHEIIRDFDGAKGKKNKKETSMPAAQQLFVASQCDVIFHAEYGEREDGTKDLVFTADPSADFTAKNRGDKVPTAWIVPRDPKKAWDQYAGFFKDPKNIQAAYTEFKKYYE